MRRRAVCPSGVTSSKSSSSAGISTKRRFSTCSCGKRHSLVRECQPSEQQDVDVDRSRPMPHTAIRTPQLSLQALDVVEKLERLELCLHEHARIQEARLVEHLADRVGVVHRRGCRHPYADGPQGVGGRL